jgi:NAD(P)-dependent dehydrogenase (short-subunit alcohol dehydrogenase family)
MDLGLDGKVAVVTGGTRGIGREIIETLASEGCRIVFCARNPSEVAQAQAAFDGSGLQTRGFTADVGDAASYGAFLAQASEAFGGVDIFVPNVSAGGGLGDERFWRNSFEVDMLGAVRGCEALTPVMAARGGGAIVLTSSTAALESFVGPMAYNAMKAALLNYGKNLSQKVAPQQIRVNAIAPGPVYFPGGSWATREASAPEAFQAVLAQIPMGRMASPADVARAVAFLASPAAAYITGVTVTIDGGFTKRVDF